METRDAHLFFFGKRPNGARGAFGVSSNEDASSRSRIDADPKEACEIHDISVSGCSSMSRNMCCIREVRMLEGQDRSSRDESILSRSRPGVFEAIDAKVQ